MKKIGLLLILLLAGSAQASQFIRITKNDSVIGYKEPTTQSKMLSVFKEGDRVELVTEKDGWYKVKIPYNQGYFIVGWILKNSPFLVIESGGTSVAGITTQPIENKASTKRPTATGVNRSAILDDQSEQYTHSARLFAGPVFNLHKYGAFQYKFGFSYEIPLTESFRLGVPVSYTTGKGFHSILFGLESVYAFYFDAFSVAPLLGMDFEYFYGKGKSFEAFTAEAGVLFEFPLFDRLSLGVEPIGAQAMLWNTTDSINRIPFNIRGQSLIFIRGSW